MPIIVNPNLPTSGDPLYPVQSIYYRQYIKETFVEGLRSVFASHPDDLLRRTKVNIEFPLEKADYPSIIVVYQETRPFRNAGVGHYELLPTPDDTGRYIKYKHYLYDGNIQFKIFALTSYDRDLLADSLVQILAMGETESYSHALLNRVYESDVNDEPRSQAHFINFNSDEIFPMGDTQGPTPWQSDDEYIYQTGYSVEIFGEVFSRTPPYNSYGLIENVEVYPYSPQAGETKPNPNPEDPAPWEPFEVDDEDTP